MSLNLDEFTWMLFWDLDMTRAPQTPLQSSQFGKWCPHPHPSSHPSLTGALGLSVLTLSHSTLSFHPCCWPLFQAATNSPPDCCLLWEQRTHWHHEIYSLSHWKQKDLPICDPCLPPWGRYYYKDLYEPFQKTACACYGNIRKCVLLAKFL